MSTEIIIVLILICLNAFFAMSEMAIVSASKPMLRQRAKNGNRKAEVALRLAEDSGRFLSTVQIGITLIGIIAGAYGGATIAEKLQATFNEISFIYPYGQSVAFIFVITIITYLSVVVGELIPKQIALSKPEPIAMFVALPMALLSKICTPVVKLLEVSAAIPMKLLGLFRDENESITEEEVKAVIAEGVESGAIEKSEHDMMQRVIKLGDRDVKSIMTHRMDVGFIDINDTIAEVKEKIGRSNHSRYPVEDKTNGHIHGVVQTKDLLNQMLSGKEFQIKPLLKEIHFIHETVTCLKALELFKTSSMPLALVVDEYGDTEGLVTTADILEAIIGVIPSNYEGEDARLVLRDDGSWLVDGLTPIEEVHLMIGLDEIKTTDEYDTIAGFLLHHIGMTPKEADKFEMFNYSFEIMDMDGRRIDKILITPLVK